MTSRITASLVVCVAAAGVAVGALALDSDDPPAPAAGAPAASSGPDAGAYGTGSDAGDAGAPAGATLAIQGFAFGAASVAPGGQVTVDNADGAPHTVTAAGGAFDSGEVPARGTATFQAPGQPGSYDFACQIHPGMTGTLTVG